jgi:hypothetical protein
MGLKHGKQEGQPLGLGSNGRKWGTKWTAKFFRLVRQKNSQAIILELKDNYGRRFTRKEDLEGICLNFYQKLYSYEAILGAAMQEVLDGFQPRSRET